MRSLELQPILQLAWTKDETKPDQHGATGLRGILTVLPGVAGKEAGFPFIARADKHVRLTYAHADKRNGSYRAILDKRRSPSGRWENIIRVLGQLSTRRTGNPRICCHAANWPHQLSGCFAPGLSETETGVRDSQKAMVRVIKRLQTRVQFGEEFTLQVVKPAVVGPFR